MNFFRQACRVAPTGESFQATGVSGAGVDNADFILYISAKSLERCYVGSTVAYAAYCQLEPALDRYVTVLKLKLSVRLSIRLKIYYRFRFRFSYHTE